MTGHVIVVFQSSQLKSGLKAVRAVLIVQLEYTGWPIRIFVNTITKAFPNLCFVHMYL
jgi:hypothetical protein